MPVGVGSIVVGGSATVTAAMKVTLWPETEDEGGVERVVVVTAGWTVSVRLLGFSTGSRIRWLPRTIPL
jgi:hypothetical protein